MLLNIERQKDRRKQGAVATLVIVAGAGLATLKKLSHGGRSCLRKVNVLNDKNENLFPTGMTVALTLSKDYLKDQS